MLELARAPHRHKYTQTQELNSRAERENSSRRDENDSLNEPQQNIRNQAVDESRSLVNAIANRFSSEFSSFVGLIWIFPIGKRLFDTPRPITLFFLLPVFGIVGVY